MSVKAFLQITPKEFYLSLKSKGKYDADLVETNIKFICNTIRLSTLYLYNPIVDKKYRKSDPRKLMRFPWDKGSYKEQTANQMKNVAKMIARSTVKKTKKKKNG